MLPINADLVIFIDEIDTVRRPSPFRPMNSSPQSARC